MFLHQLPVIPFSLSLHDLYYPALESHYYSYHLCYCCAFSTFRALNMAQENKTTNLAFEIRCGGRQGFVRGNEFAPKLLLLGSPDSLFGTPSGNNEYENNMVEETRERGSVHTIHRAFQTNCVSARFPGGSCCCSG